MRGYSVFFMQAGTTKRREGSCQACVRAGAMAAGSAAGSVARVTGGAVQAAAIGIIHGIRGIPKQVHIARRWAAPRLDDTARYFSVSVAPRVSSTLRSTARRVNPDKRASQGNQRAVLLTVSAGGALLAAAGAAVAVYRSRYRPAEAPGGTTPAGETAGAPSAQAPTIPAQGTAEQAEASAEASGKRADTSGKR